MLRSSYNQIKTTLSSMANNDLVWEDNGFGSRQGGRRSSNGMERNTMVVLQGQVTKMNKILQPMALSQGGEITLTLAGEVKVRIIKGVKLVKEIITSKHLVIAKDITIIDRTTQHLIINKPPPLPYLPSHLWRLFFMSI
ncbi:hypothetical protein E5676_scaffold455G001550 [Cucumis melo var. makuwa]|uniref:Uncharacterized protein n=1 Tax=Cucumis melo var. makuwa TaxID=1194695 RepID=A0A5A7T2D3_CUCMM|nr:hypothetical protein E6C27_scaffold285G002830 [Cucumis melo var. makuwa]TYK30934.1 hypothetical protein E5676_scaffold455G001550 [Cucumis melo var. makuwa]